VRLGSLLVAGEAPARIVVALIATALVCSPGGAADTSAFADDPFPEFDSIRGHVDFWKRVWSEWSMGQVAVHDLEDPRLVYEVRELPGPIEERYSKEQSDFVERLRESWEQRLEQLEQRVVTGAALTDDEKALVLLIGSTSGSDRLEGAHERVRTQRGLRERFRRGVEISHRYHALFRAIFLERGLPEDLAYLPHVESSYQARARSSAGAVGIWQFTRGTGRRYMTVTASLDERLDPIAAARGAARYLEDAYTQLGNWPIALTAYNHGVAGMLAAVERCGPDYERVFLEYDGKLFGFASKNFYAEFLAAREVARDAERYFPEGLRPEPAFDLESIRLEHRVSPARIAGVYGLGLDELAELNPAWTNRAVRSGQVLPAGSTVWLPTGTLAGLAAAGGQPDLSPVEGIVTQTTYAVRRGDTLSGIAWAHGMRLDDLRVLNGMAEGSSLIRVGQQLVVEAPTDLSVHVVRRGDTLSGIAHRYGVSTNLLREINDIPAGSSLIRVGQRLAVPAADGGAVHVVRSGETLSLIAARYGVRLMDLLAVNGLSLRSLIHPGQAIRIPHGG